MAGARERLAAQAAAAGYPPALLATIAEATLPRYRAGQRLDDAQIAHITDAVETLAQAGLDADAVTALIAECRRRHGERWRDALWTQVLRVANARYARPERYGLSPCETDPARLAAHSASAAARPARVA